MYIKISYKFHRIPDTQSSVLTKVYDFLGQPSYILGILNFCKASQLPVIVMGNGRGIPEDLNKGRVLYSA